MSKQSKKYVIKTEQNNVPRWEELRDLNLTIRKDMITIIRNLAKLKAIIYSNPLLKNDEELIKIYNGVEEELKSIKELLEKTTLAHSKIVEKNNKKMYQFFTGEVDITDDKQYKIFQDSITGYSGISQMLITLSNSSLISISTKIAEILERNKKQEEENKENVNVESNNENKDSDKE
jgi:hypothetical protein